MRAWRIAIAVGAGALAMLVTPVTASADPVNDLLNQVSDTVNNTVGGLLGGDRQANDRQPKGGGETGYIPPAHGTNPHGMGTVSTIDIGNLLDEPETLPLPYPPSEGGEDLIVGQSRGEQNPDGTYHGHVTVLALLGEELVGADTDEGDSEGGPLLVEDLNDALDDLCFDTGGNLCLSVLDVDSETDENGSENSFETVGVGLFGESPLPVGLFASFGRSSGEIHDDGECQTANGESSLIDVGAPFIEFQGATAESTSTACNDGSTEQENESKVLFYDLRGLELGVEEDCEDGVPNTPLFDIFVAAAICNADDSSQTGGTQLDDPYGVREGLTLFVLPFLLDGGTDTLGTEGGGELFFTLVKTTFAAAESFAVAPPEEPPPPETPPQTPPGGGNQPEGSGGGQDEPNEGPGGPVRPGEPTGETAGTLPFTGSELLTLALIGLGVMGTGLAAMALVDRRRGPSQPR